MAFCKWCSFYEKYFLLVYCIPMKKHINDILLVDDDAITNFLNETLLQEMNVADHIDIVYDGLKALDFIKKYWTYDEFTIQAPDDKLILLDINMSTMNGFEFLEHFEKIGQSQKVTVALLTTSVNKQDMNKAENYKVKDYIEKPLNEDKIKSLLMKL